MRIEKDRLEEDIPDEWFQALRQHDKEKQRVYETPPADPESIPDEFRFESKIIFISNLTEIPEAIGDRTLSIQLNYDKEQALKLIEQKLDQLVPEYPDLTIEDKREIVAFMRKHKKSAERISFRTFIHIAAIWKSNDPNKEKWALLQLTSKL
jgi:hypothetical protein